MFGKKKQSTASSSGSSLKRTNHTPSIISEDVRLTGSLTSQGEVQLDGRIEGDLHVKHLVIGHTGMIEGVIEADSARQVRQQLREKGYAPLSVEQNVETKQSTNNLLTQKRRLSIKELAMLTRQIATLIQAGIPIEETLSAVASQSEKTNIRSKLWNNTTPNMEKVKRPR